MFLPFRNFPSTCYLDPPQLSPRPPQLAIASTVASSYTKMILRHPSLSKTTLARCFSTTLPTSSHIGTLTIPIPSGVSLDYPALVISPDTPMTSESGRRILSVTGPLGSQSVLVLPPVIIKPPSSDSPNLAVAVHNPKLKKQKAVWGFSRTMINNAIVGVSKGYTLDIKLVGVGYRASIEPIPEVFLEMMKRAPPKIKATKPGTPPQPPRTTPTQRLNLKLGYSHPVLIDIPSDIKVEMTSPTTILLSGMDKMQLGLFAASIRKKRKPEPYRGKVGHLPSRPVSLLTCVTGDFRWRRDDQVEGDQEEVRIGWGGDLGLFCICMVLDIVPLEGVSHLR